MKRSLRLGLALVACVAGSVEKGIVWIKWVGTHRDYDEIDVAKVQYGGK